MEGLIHKAVHYPRLDTVIMVEETIKNSKKYMTKAQLARSLPKKTMYQTLLVILDYLQSSNKIHIDKKDGRIIWIWNPAGVNEVKNASLLVKT